MEYMVIVAAVVGLAIGVLADVFVVPRGARYILPVGVLVFAAAWAAYGTGLLDGYATLVFGGAYVTSSIISPLFTRRREAKVA